MEVNRLEYRTPREPKAVCVYTIAQESRHLIIENIPSLGLVKDLVAKFSSFGEIDHHSMLDDHQSSTDSTDVFYIIYNNIACARKAKRIMDDKVFFTHRLRIYYAPEYETPQDIRDKFNERFQTIQKRCYKTEKSYKKHIKPTRKRQYDDEPPLIEQDTLIPDVPALSPSVNKNEVKETPTKRRRI